MLATLRLTLSGLLVVTALLLNVCLAHVAHGDADGNPVVRTSTSTSRRGSASPTGIQSGHGPHAPNPPHREIELELEEEVDGCLFRSGSEHDWQIPVQLHDHDHDPNHHWQSDPATELPLQYQHQHKHKHQHQHQHQHQHKPTWKEKYGAQIDLPFTGPLSFSHLPYTKCLEDTETRFDIAILGFPFDTAVSYRPGARFGPYAIRSGSRRQHGARGYTLSWGVNPYTLGLKIVDCGDVPISPFDNALAVDQMEVGYSTLLARPVAMAMGRNLNSNSNFDPATGDDAHPRIVTLGGDHTIVLPILRSLHKIYGPISVIHFDAHLDTWAAYPGQSSEQSRVTHGTFFYLAKEEGLLANNSVHAGIRCKMGGLGDLENDDAVGFQVISTDDIDDLGIATIIKIIRKRIGKSPVYLSLDIDVIDPGLAPATGTPEAGGWTTREVKRIIRGLAGLNFVGADIVEVAPAYDHADITGIAAADLVHDFLSLLQAKEPPSPVHRRSSVNSP